MRKRLRLDDFKINGSIPHAVKVIDIFFLVIGKNNILKLKLRQIIIIY